MRPELLKTALLTAACLACAFALQAQSGETPGDSTAIVAESTTDTLSGREKRQLRQLERYRESGPFFDHSERPGRKAALYSFAFPGLGQIYNRKYWKLPIVYGAVGTGLYFAGSNGRQLKRYNTALEIRLDGGNDEFTGLLSEAELLSRRNFYRRNTELSALITGVLYGLNIIDAVVDAHLFDFDISDDLSFRWQPDLLTGNNQVFPAIRLSLTLN